MLRKGKRALRGDAFGATGNEHDVGCVEGHLGRRRRDIERLEEADPPRAHRIVVRLDEGAGRCRDQLAINERVEAGMLRRDVDHADRRVRRFRVERVRKRGRAAAVLDDAQALWPRRIEHCVRAVEQQREVVLVALVRQMKNAPLPRPLGGG